MAERGTGRKRKRPQQQQQIREKLQQYGMDLPEIPGLPVHIIPLHVFALRKTGIFFRKDATEKAVAPFLTEQEQTQTDESTASAVAAAAATGRNDDDDDGVVDALMQRVQHAATTETRNSEVERQRRQRLLECRDAVKSWLEALRREVKDARNGSALLAAMEHLWEFLMQDREKISIRRTCLHLVGHLLEKSTELRRWFLDESNRLGKWTEILINTQNENNSACHFFQREGFMLLKKLDSSGYSDLYPRLRVAMQRLRQNLPWIAEEVSSESMAAALGLSRLREIRDVAIQHWQKETDIVRRLLNRSDKCMRILVPRFGEETPAAVSAVGVATTQQQQTTMDDEDEDDDIDWEDGFVEEDADVDNQGNLFDQPQESHQDAVERTLAVMQSSARMRTGQLEINFDASTEEKASVTTEMVEAKERLGTCVERLRSRHVGRLNTWVDALTRADNLVSGDGGSLVQMTLDARSHRRMILQSALQLKAEVSSCLSSAKRLIAEAEVEAEGNQGNVMRHPAASLNFHPAPRNERLATALNHRGPRAVDHSKKRSAKIRIRYR